MHENKNCFSVVVPDEPPKPDQELPNCQEEKANGSERQAEHSDRAKSFIRRVANRSREIFMPLNTPGHWKVRAQEARVLAEALKAHPEAFAAMLKIADEYERLADRAAPSASRAHRRRYHRQSDGRAGALRNY